MQSGSVASATAIAAAVAGAALEGVSDVKDV